MSEASAGDRKFDPTPQRRAEFRKQGRFARSRDAAGLASAICVVGVLLGSRAGISQVISSLFLACHGNLAALAHGQPVDAMHMATMALAAIALPSLVAGAAGAAIAGLAQSGFVVDFGNVGIKPERFNPIGRLQQLVSPQRAGIEMVLSLLRVGAVGYVAYRAALGELGDLLSLARLPLDLAIGRMVGAALHVLWAAGGAIAVIAIIDYAQSRFRVEQEMKMTRQELMEEMKRSEGDPKLKARAKARARALARKRALQSIKKATVVVTNPTHIAVALRYDAGDAAPVVLAKGHDDDALRIRAEARKHGIPILENRPLARALDAEVPIGHIIPMAHFAAVARVLAFVYRIKGRRPGAARAVRNRRA
jgi:flagellar biosynthetic protein FlhB